MTCTHHWICEDVSGLTSRARCRKCKAVKEFDNYLRLPKWTSSATTSRRMPRQPSSGTGPPDRA